MNEIERLQQLAGVLEQPRSTTLLSEVDVNEGEGSVDKVAVGHIDNEADMMRKQLFIMGSQCVELYKMLGDIDNGDFPHWWQAKIIKAAEYLGAAHDYLDSEINAPEQETMVSDDAADSSDPSGVS